MELHPDDILVIPELLDIDTDSLPCQYLIMKHLFTPSIVSSRHKGYPMQTMASLDSAKGVSIVNMLMRYLRKPAKPVAKAELEGTDLFFRHIRIRNEKTGEYFNNKGASILVDLRAHEGRFFFTFSICSSADNYSKVVANGICLDRMKDGTQFECINYDPALSIAQNLYLAIGVQDGKYPLSEYDWQGILPELYGDISESQMANLRKLRKLIRNKSGN